MAKGNVLFDKKTIFILRNLQTDHTVNTLVRIAKFDIKRGRFKKTVLTIQMTTNSIKIHTISRKVHLP